MEKKEEENQHHVVDDRIHRVKYDKSGDISSDEEEMVDLDSDSDSSSSSDE